MTGIHGTKEPARTQSFDEEVPRARRGMLATFNPWRWCMERALFLVLSSMEASVFRVYSEGKSAPTLESGATTI